jgi:hypothetical protein
MRVNGVDCDRSWLPFDSIAGDGTLAYKMGGSAGSWAQAPSIPAFRPYVL